MSWLEPFRFNMLTHPWVLFFLVFVAILFFFEIGARPFSALSISTGETLARIRGGGKVLARRIPPVLRALGLALLLVALARPLAGMTPRVERQEVVDILLCVDVSGSMNAEDFVVNNRRVDRLAVTKRAVQDFIETRKVRQEHRFGMDRVGLVLYAAHAWMQCPLTLDYGVFERELESVFIDENDEKAHRTAIGSAIGLAVNRLNQSEARSKVIILLTDGINNYGNLDPLTAAQLAKDYGIRVYTIGAGSPEGGLVTQNTPLGRIVTGRSEPIDEESLQRIADVTGGRYYRATDLESLQGAYQEINELEATEIEMGEVYDYKDAFMPYAIAGAIALGGSLVTRRLWFEPIP